MGEIKFKNMDAKKELNVKYINLELTSRCNLKCPFCSREYSPFRRGRYKIDFDIDWIYKLGLESTEKIILCGSFGDSIFYPHLMEFLKRAYDINKKLIISLHTNGTAHDKQWWIELCSLLQKFKSHKIIFALDGLEDTHKIHRIGGSFKNTIRNMKTCIDGGSWVVWQFIIFKHNQHQITDVYKLSKKLGCEEFIVRKSFFYKLKWERPTFPKIMTKIEMGQQKLGNIKCRIDDQEIAILSTGDVIPCCHVIPVTYKNLGFEPMNLKYHTLKEIIDAGYIQKVWSEIEAKPFCQNCRDSSKCLYTVNELIMESIRVHKWEREQKKDSSNKQ